MRENDNLYDILQVHSAASAEVIEAAYKRLMRLYHPDVNGAPEAHDMAARLNAAYEVLGNPDRRAEYDRWSEHGGRPVEAASSGKRKPSIVDAARDQGQRLLERTEEWRDEPEERRTPRADDSLDEEWVNHEMPQTGTLNTSGYTGLNPVLDRNLWEAARDGDAEGVESLLSSGANPYAMRFTWQNGCKDAMGIAARREHLHIVNLIADFAGKGKHQYPVSALGRLPIDTIAKIVSVLIPLSVSLWFVIVTLPLFREEGFSPLVIILAVLVVMPIVFFVVWVTEHILKNW